MAENRSVIELKRRKLIEELNRENPNRFKIERLKQSIKRHKEIGRKISRRRKNKKW